MISISKRPEKFSPSGNSVIWQVRSNNPNILFFNVEVFDVATSSLIHQQRTTPTPASPQESFLNLSKILSSVVRYEINNSSKLVVPIQKTVRSYKLRITERILNPLTGQISNGHVLDDTNDVSYIFSAKLGRIQASNYIQIKHVIGTNNLATFLTFKPNFSKVNDVCAEHLYFLHDSQSGLRVRIRTYDKANNLLFTKVQTIQDLEDFKMFRLNVSPKALKQSINLSMKGVSRYVVDIVDSLLQPKTEERVYIYESTPCHLDFVNLLWVNPLGGIDSYSFIAPQDSITVNRFTIKRSVERINSDGVYADSNEGVLNPSDVIIDLTTKSETKVTSQSLNDAEAYWLSELFMSTQLFIEMGDGTLVPAILNNTSYNIPRLKYVRNQPNAISVEFTLSDNVIPVGQQAYSIRQGSFDFIESQMNALEVSLPGYGITTETSGNDYSDLDYGVNYG